MTAAALLSTTPRFTEHARQRCTEMGLTTKQVKRTFRTAALDYPGPEQHGANRIRVGDGIAIAYSIGPDGTPVVCTVLWDGIDFVRPES